MASLFAARLSAVGIPITMLGSWPAGLIALREYGVRIVETDGSERSFPVRVTDDPQTCIGSKYALVLVKSWGTARAARQLVECLAPDGLALTLQNGLGNRGVLTKALGNNRVSLGVTTCGANLIEPGLVRSAGEGVISLASSIEIKPIADILKGGGFNIEYTSDPAGLIWGKLVVNAAINPLTALLKVPNGALLERPSARSLMASIALETMAVAQAHDIQLPYTDPVKVVEDVAHRTAANRSSMLQDIERGTPTEIDAINGAIVRAADEAGVPSPVNRTVWQLVNAKEQGIGSKG
jgi:2-dehydropantoate 2-reductase